MNKILAFTLISLLLVMSPGPNSVLILKTVSGRGCQSGVENIFGLVLATFVFVSIHAAIIFFWFLGMSVFISKVKLIASHTRLGLWVQRFSGGVLIAFSGLLVSHEVEK